MNKELEKYLWDKLDEVAEDGYKIWPRLVINEMYEKGMIKNKKQAIATLYKWVSKGLWDYGVSITAGFKPIYEDDWNDRLKRLGF